MCVCVHLRWVCVANTFAVFFSVALNIISCLIVNLSIIFCFYFIGALFGLEMAEFSSIILVSIFLFGKNPKDLLVVQMLSECYKVHQVALQLIKVNICLLENLN